MTGKREKTAALSKGRQQGGLQKAALYFWKHKYLYLMLLPAILYYIIFCYVPMYGVTIAFKDFNPMLGIWKSPWAGTEMFQKLFGKVLFRFLEHDPDQPDPTDFRISVSDYHCAAFK